MAFVRELFQNPCIPAYLRQDALDRVYSDPGIPDPIHSTSSYWMKEPHPQLVKHQTQTLPQEADIVIIGSGITATSVAQTLLQCPGTPGNYASTASFSSGPKVVMLEARDICSGATGRNGGHILETAEEYSELLETHGKEAAVKIMRFRLAHLEILLQEAERLGLGVDAQARRVQYVSAYFDDALWLAAKKSIEAFKTDLPLESTAWGTIEGDVLRKEFQLPHAVGAICGPAGAIWPYKFVTGVQADLRKRFPRRFLVKSNTAVTGIVEGAGSFNVFTSRGVVSCKHVVHCTNAHIGHLVPGLLGRIFPIRGQMSAQTPGENFPHQGDKHSWLFNYSAGYDYLTQLPSSSTSDNEMMFGGGFAQIPGNGITEIGIATDSGLNLYADIHLSGALGAIFGRENWGSVPGKSVKSMWTGNMGFSTDRFPWVGRIPDSLSHRRWSPLNAESCRTVGAEWVAAAFSGEGMVNAWLCGKALGMMLISHENLLQDSAPDILQWFPEQMLLTMDRLKEAALPRVVVE